MPFSRLEKHVDAALTDYSHRVSNAEFSLEKILPVVPVPKSSGKYWKHGNEHLIVPNDDYQPGGEINELQVTRSTDSYLCDGRALGQLVPDEDYDDADDAIEPELEAVQDVTEAIYLAQDKRGATLLTTAANLGASSTPGTLWSSSGSDPIGDICKTAQRTVHSKVFKVPNKLVMNFQVAQVLAWHADIKDLVKQTVKLDLTQLMSTLATGGTIPAMGNLVKEYGGIKVELPQYLFGMEVIIYGAGENTANRGQAESLSYVWGSHVLVAYVHPTPGRRTLTLGKIFRWKPFQVLKERIPTKGNFIHVKHYTDEKITAANAGYLLTNVI